jgi:phage baseplate assembly protein W
LAFYAYSRKLDPLTGDYPFDTNKGTWIAGHPMAERIHRCLRTPRGSAMRDPDYGLDTSQLDNARPNAESLLKNAIVRALDRYVKAGLLKTQPTVTTEKQGNLILYEVRFLDPQDQPGAVSGSV